MKHIVSYKLQIVDRNDQV